MREELIEKMAKVMGYTIEEVENMLKYYPKTFAFHTEEEAREFLGDGEVWDYRWTGYEFWDGQILQIDLLDDHDFQVEDHPEDDNLSIYDWGIPIVAPRNLDTRFWVILEEIGENEFVPYEGRLFLTEEEAEKYVKYIAES